MVVSNNKETYSDHLFAIDSNLKKIINAVEYCSGISFLQMCSSSRNRPIVDARHTAMYFIKQHSKLTLHQIGLLFGFRDHSSILHAIRKVEDWQINKEYKLYFTQIEQRVNQNLSQVTEDDYNKKLREVYEILELRIKHNLSALQITNKLLNINETNSKEKSYHSERSN